MRLIATRADLFGPSAGATFRTDTRVQNTESSVQATKPPIPVTQLFGNLKGSVVAQPVLWLFGLIGVLVAYKLIEEHRGGREGFEEIKLGLNNVVKIGLVAMIFFVVAKYYAVRYEVPGLSSFIRAA